MIIHNAIFSNEITLLGDGSRLQNYIHVDDVAVSLVAAAKTRVNGIFLSVSDCSNTNIEIAQVIKKYLPSIIIKFSDIDESLSSTFDAFCTYNTLNWKNRMNLNSGIEQVIEWLKKEY